MATTTNTTAVSAVKSAPASSGPAPSAANALSNRIAKGSLNPKFGMRLPATISPSTTSVIQSTRLAGAASAYAGTAAGWSASYAGAVV